VSRGLEQYIEAWQAPMLMEALDLSEFVRLISQNESEFE
jgi:hypothetical protein